MTRSVQRGSALMVALILLLVITVFAIAAARMTTLETRIAVNDELRVAAFERAQSVVDAAMADPANTPVVGDVDSTFCTAPAASGCLSSPTITLPSGMFASDIASGAVAAKVRRLGPLFAPPPRATGSSISLFTSARFQVEGTYDQGDSGHGSVQVNEGVVLVIPKS